MLKVPKKAWGKILGRDITDTDTLAVIARRGGKKILENTLGRDFNGTMVVDEWKFYSTFTRRIQRCWAHLLREVDWLAEHVSEAGALQRALHKLYGGLKASLEDDPPPKKTDGAGEERQDEVALLVEALQT